MKLIDTSLHVAVPGKNLLCRVTEYISSTHEESIGIGNVKAEKFRGAFGFLQSRNPSFYLNILFSSINTVEYGLTATHGNN